MWIFVKAIVGSTLGRTVVSVLVVGLILFSTIQYVQWQERERLLKEIQLEDLENYKDTRERIDESTSTVFDGVDAALEWLRNRNKD